MRTRSRTGMALAGIAACASLVAACRPGSAGQVVAREAGGEGRVGAGAEAQIADVVSAPLGLPERATDAAALPTAVTSEEAEARARTTDAARAFLDRYSPCEGCTIHDEPGDAARIGCVSYRVRPGCASGADAGCDDLWIAAYWVGGACSFRLGRSEQPIEVQVDRRTGQVVATSPPTPYVLTTDYCETGADCRCLSGSGVPFIGCANSLHAPLHSAGSYACERCDCQERRCVDRDGAGGSGPPGLSASSPKTRHGAAGG